MSILGIAEGFWSASPREGRVEGFELSLRRTDGSVIRALMSAREIQFRGSPALVAACTDITSRLETEQALRTSEARLQAFMQHAPAGMYLKDLEGRYVVANPEMERVQNRPVSEIIGRTPEDVFAPEHAAMIRGYDRQVLRTGASVVNEEYVPYFPHYVWRLVIRFPIRDEAGRDSPTSPASSSTSATGRRPRPKPTGSARRCTSARSWRRSARSWPAWRMN